VLVASVLIAMTARSLLATLSGLVEVGGVFDTLVSTLFLFAMR
jgi:high-affinity nickel permease